MLSVAIRKPGNVEIPRKIALQALAMRVIVLATKSTAQMAPVGLNSETVFAPGNGGDCCNMSGKCGTGASFCGKEVCLWGNCQRPVITPSLPPWLSTGNTTDGTCGGPKSMTCNVVYGNCCNKSGFCGSLPSDCGTGCQPKWGNCTSTTSVSSVSPTSTKPSTTSSSKISSTSSRTSTTSSSSTSTSCTGVALATPTSSGSLCGINANSIAMTGTGGLINYTSGPYVTDPQACAAICKKTATCTNFYFILNTACNLKYGPVSYVINNSGVNVYRLYTASCFACSTCHSAAIAAPAPAGSLCNIQANGMHWLAPAH
ncbi:hypothetical protein BKA61DRAFT_736786 [Leptodontidium sp. MPI-SDFR-AT-0119]|nr:hypothetical protein BKA61DRAFT_736786 [Leptodontidium sp. MPI-SDFR-AT-0119]